MLERETSKDGRIELLELLRLRARCSLGSEGFKPDALANRFRMSVNVTTPVRRPEMLAPDTVGAGTGLGWTVAVAVAFKDEDELDVGFGTTTLLGLRRGVAGEEGDGEADSTTHIRCDRVATSLATVWARVE
jgi:hypothetical protein